MLGTNGVALLEDSEFGFSECLQNDYFAIYTHKDMHNFMKTIGRCIPSPKPQLTALGNGLTHPNHMV